MSKFSQKFYARLERILPTPLYRFLRALETFFVKFILQTVLGTAALLIVYIFVIGSTSLVVRLFFRSSLKSKTLEQGRTWIQAKHYDADLERSYFQS